MPGWHITTPEGSYLVLTPFDHNKPGQRERALFLSPGSWLGGWRRVSCSPRRRGLDPRSRVRATRRCSSSAFPTTSAWRRCSGSGALQWSPSSQWSGSLTEQVEEAYFKLLPTGRSEVPAEEAAEPTIIFGKDGEMQAERLS